MMSYADWWCSAANHYLLPMLHCIGIMKIEGRWLDILVLKYITFLHSEGIFWAIWGGVNFFFSGLPAEPIYLPGVPGRNSQ